MPRLLRTVARTAVIAGTATTVSNRVSRRQGNRWAKQEASQEASQEAPEPEQAEDPSPADTTPSKLDMLSQLGELHANGTLTDEEFAAEKAKILG
jgi:putative oligomerization/nucleic acid binding protein